MNIKKKLVALSAVLAIFASFAGCSDDGDSSKTTGNNAVVNYDDEETLSPEELDQVTKHDLTIQPFEPGSEDVQQDAVEDNSSADNNTTGDSNNNVAGENNNTPAADNNSDKVADNDPGSNNAELPPELQVHNGTRTTMQAWWMDISKKEDYIFNGEYLVAEFKIKDGTADGIYPITLDWLDFANWDSKTVKFTGIDGAVIVGGEATENKFNDDDTPQIMVQNVSGKAGDTVKVSINVQNNPGVVANILRFSYNSDVLEYVGGGEGADFNGHFK